MITDRITVYRCFYCRRSWRSKSTCLDHEPHCYKNAKRTPWIGEVTTHAQEWIFADRSTGASPTWWPGVGKLWNGERWIDIPGYEPAPTWEGSDRFPAVGSTTLDRVRPASIRVEWLRELAMPSEAPF